MLLTLVGDSVSTGGRVQYDAKCPVMTSGAAVDGSARSFFQLELH